MAKLKGLLITVNHGFGMPAIRLANTVVALIACILFFGSDAHSQQTRNRTHESSRRRVTRREKRETLHFAVFPSMH